MKLVERQLALMIVKVANRKSETVVSALIERRGTGAWRWRTTNAHSSDGYRHLLLRSAEPLRNSLYWHAGFEAVASSSFTLGSLPRIFAPGVASTA